MVSGYLLAIKNTKERKVPVRFEASRAQRNEPVLLVRPVALDLQGPISEIPQPERKPHMTYHCRTNFLYLYIACCR